MSKPQQMQTLLRVLATLHEALRKLAALLTQEQQALREKDINSMQQLAADKEALSAQVETLEQERRQLCRDYQIEADLAGLKQFLRDTPAAVARKAQDLWAAISEIGATCQEQNQINGILVAHQHRYTQDALAILRGAVAGNEVYSAKGARANQGGQHSLGRV